jgi:hypothetical protein
MAMYSSSTNSVLHRPGKPGERAGLSEILRDLTDRHADNDLRGAIIFIILTITMYWMVPLFLLMLFSSDGVA